MEAYSYSRRNKSVSKGLLCVGLVLVFALLLSACGGTANTSSGSGSSSTPSPAATTVAAPTDLLVAGTLTVGSDTTYPPQEYIDTATNQATGFDIDLITAIGKQMGLQTKVDTTSFDTIINSLISKRFDVVISAVTINAERQQKVDFVPYFNAGESLLVKAGNPLHISSTADLCGQNVGVQNGTVEQTDLTTATEACKKAGKAAIAITALTNQTDVIQLLATGRVVATYQDSPVTDYYNKLHPGQFTVGGSVVNAAPEGIVVRKGDASMLTAVQTAFNQVKANGTYTALIQKWGLTNEALP